MPTIQTRDGIVLDLEDGLDPNGPEARAAVAAERQQRMQARHATPEWQEKVRAQQEADRAEYDPTKGMSRTQRVLANIGAGFEDIHMGVDQLRGKASGEDYREKVARDRQLSASTTGGRLLQGLGQVGATLPAAMAASALAPAAAAGVAGGAVLGGAQGLLAPTEMEDVGTGKALGTAVGAATGGLANKYLPVILPKVAGGLQRGTEALRDVARRFTGAGRQTLAQDAFTATIPQTEQAATIAALKGHRDIPGTLPTTGQVTRNQGLLETERKLGSTGGEAASDLLRRRGVSNQARHAFLADEFKGDPAVARQAASDFAEASKPTAFTQPFKPAPVLGEITRLKNLSSDPKVHAVLDDIAERVRASVASNNPVEQLHLVRMTSIDDKLGALAQTDSKLAGHLSRQLSSVKKALDLQLNKATGGQWDNFLQGYSKLAGVADQTEAGAALMGKVNQAMPDVTGTPNVSSLRRSVMSKEASGVDPASGARMPQLDKFGKPVYSDTGQATIDDTLASLHTEAGPSTVHPASSATAANISAPQQAAEKMLGPVMGKPLREGWGPEMRASLGGTVGAGVGAMLPVPGGTALGAMAGAGATAVGEKLIAKQSMDIARKLLSHYTDPVVALRALEQAVQAGQVPRNLAASVAKFLGGNTGSVGQDIGVQFLRGGFLGPSVNNMLPGAGAPRRQ